MVASVNDALGAPASQASITSVGNIGDSRVLLGRADGSIFPGPGTDNGLTTDCPAPKKRGTVERGTEAQAAHFSYV